MTRRLLALLLVLALPLGAARPQRVVSQAVGTDELLLALACLLYTSPSPRDGLLSRMPSSA